MYAPESPCVGFYCGNNYAVTLFSSRRRPFTGFNGPERFANVAIPANVGNVGNVGNAGNVGSSICAPSALSAVSVVNRPSLPPEVQQWLRSLDDRHLANLTVSEAARALRALSSCYVERRAKLAEGARPEPDGKIGQRRMDRVAEPLASQRTCRCRVAIEAARDGQQLGCGATEMGRGRALREPRRFEALHDVGRVI